MSELTTIVSLLAAFLTLILNFMVRGMLKRVEDIADIAEEKLETARQRLAKVEALETKYIKENL